MAPSRICATSDPAAKSSRVFHGLPMCEGAVRIFAAAALELQDLSGRAEGLEPGSAISYRPFVRPGRLDSWCEHRHDAAFRQRFTTYGKYPHNHAGKVR
jgi:hypothetical protein